MKYKSFVLIFIFSLGLNQCSIAQYSEEDALKMIKGFYYNYISEVAGDNPPFVMEQNLDLLRRKHCTARMSESLGIIVENTEADAFLKVQDVSIESLETLNVKRDTIGSNQYVISYYDVYSQKVILIKLVIVNSSNGLKIDEIVS
tara:strand:+ start:84082 stop:84516 length:435 start_codon:yes stop_codon:yes gene_type:complete